MVCCGDSSENGNPKEDKIDMKYERLKPRLELKVPLVKA